MNKSKSAVQERPQETRPGSQSLIPRLIGWQGFTLNVPEDWDLTGFSGDDQSGYVRVDDSDDMAVEIKWGTEPKKSKIEPDPTGRRETYLAGLQKTGKKKKLEVQTRELETFRPAQRENRTVAGFTWSGDRKAVGVVWYCRTSRRVVIAQVLGPAGGRANFGTLAEAILGSIESHTPGDYTTWCLYDLHTQVPNEYKLATQQLMNVYLRLSFVHRRQQMATLSIEQWAMANVARRGAYLDAWLSANAKGEMKSARYTAGEGEVQTHPALTLKGGPAFGMPMIEVVKQASRFHLPATRFGGVAWECEPSNKLYLIEEMLPFKVPSRVNEIAERTVCHRVAKEG